MTQEINEPKPTEASSSESVGLATRLQELAQVFLKLGIIGFGGPQAHIAMENDEAVVRRQWMTQDEFTDGLAVCEMLPGPASTQMGIYIGYVRAGQLGALVAGLSFIAPAFLIVVALSWAYFRYQGLPQVEALFFGVSPVVVAIVLGFCWKLGKKAIQQWHHALIAIAVFVLTLISPISVLLQFIVAGLIGLWLYGPRGPYALTPPSNRANGWLLPILPSLSIIPTVLGTATTDVLSLSSFWGWERIQDYVVPLTTFFIKVGAFIFGGGLVIIPLLEFEVVDTLNWLTRSEFINGVAIGQLSPGPVVLTSAFIGYKVAGCLGALVSAIAIFLPSFAFIMLASPLLLKLRQNPWIKGFLRGVMPGVLGAIAAALIPIAQSAFLQETWPMSLGAIAIGIAALAALLRYKTPTWQLVPAGAILGLIIGFL
ncbi:MAG TPA: chromate efflux transporter [Elainellaceae cyanobacterium]